MTATSAPTNVNLVQTIFQAFGEGDIAYILNQLTDDCHWTQSGEQSEIPTSGTRIGLNGAAEFFSTLSQTERITRFEPREFFGSGDDVVVLGFEEMEAIPTGKTASFNWAMIFRFKGDKVSRWEMLLDTAAMAKAYVP